MCELLNSRRTLTLPYPKFVGLKQPSEACFGFATVTACCHSPSLSRLFLFIYVLLSVFFAAPFPCALSQAQAHAHAKALSLSLSLSFSLSFSRLSGLPRSQRSDVPTLPTTTTATTNGFHFHCAAHSPPSPPLPPPLPPSSASPPRLLVHATHARHALGRFCFVSFRFVSLRSRLCSLLSGSVLGLRRISRFSVSVRESTVHAAVANQSAPTSQKKTHRDKA